MVCHQFDAKSFTSNNVLLLTTSARDNNVLIKTHIIKEVLHITEDILWASQWETEMWTFDIFSLSWQSKTICLKQLPVICSAPVISLTKSKSGLLMLPGVTFCNQSFQSFQTGVSSSVTYSHRPTRNLLPPHCAFQHQQLLCADPQ